MNITEVRIQILKKPAGKLMAFAAITLDNALVIKDFQIFSSARGYFVGMPSRKLPDGTWKETVFPIETSLADAISGTILRAFEDEMSKPENQLP